MDRVIAACGIVCSECRAYKATKANDARAVAKVAEDWSREYNTDIRPEYVWCDGCMTDGEHKCGHCADCDIRACALGRSLRNCALCEDYPCEKNIRFFGSVPGCKEVLDSIRAERSI